MITLHDWFQKNTKQPLALVIAIAVCFWFFSLIALTFSQLKERSAVISHLGGAITIAYNQKNRVALESLINSAAVMLKVQSISLCQGNQLVVGFNAKTTDCALTNLSSLFVLPGSPDVQIKGSFPTILSNPFLWMVGFFGLFFVFLSAWILRQTHAKILKNILDPVQRGLLSDLPLSIIEFESIRNNLNEAKKLEKIKAVSAAIELRNRQIAHDIRSPLSALNMIVGQLGGAEESHRLIVRSSVNRINDIANSLLNQTKDQNNHRNQNKHKDQNDISGQKDQQGRSTILGVSSDARSEVPGSELLSVIVDSIVSEKRLQYREIIGIEIQADLSQAYGAIAKVNPSELKRVISNLINNAIEALPNSKGNILISVSSNADSHQISIKDNGKGIPAHVLKQLGEMGVTHGKEGTQSGSGLGVYHAKKTIEDAGGRLEIETKLGEGTTFFLRFPKAPPPKWFVDKVTVFPGMQVISLDDDLSIHQVWENRLATIRTLGNGIKHITFTSGVEFKAWYSTTDKVSGHEYTGDRQAQAHGQDHGYGSGYRHGQFNRIFLIDYELLNQSATGLDIIEELGIGAQAILVSSRYDELAIRARCEKIGVRLIPKTMAGFVPIECNNLPLTSNIDPDVSPAIGPSLNTKLNSIAAAVAKPPLRKPDAIILDDEPLQKMMWQMVASEKSKQIEFFETPSELMANLDAYDKAVSIYVDSNLGHGVKGENVTLQLYQLGFTNLYLATGYPASNFAHLTFLRGVVGKDPVL